jgi:hypothetical protein
VGDWAPETHVFIQGYTTKRAVAVKVSGATQRSAKMVSQCVLDSSCQAHVQSELWLKHERCLYVRLKTPLQSWEATAEHGLVVDGTAVYDDVSHLHHCSPDGFGGVEVAAPSKGHAQSGTPKNPMCIPQRMQLKSQRAKQQMGSDTESWLQVALNLQT